MNSDDRWGWSDLLRTFAQVTILSVALLRAIQTIADSKVEVAPLDSISNAGLGVFAALGYLMVGALAVAILQWVWPKRH